MTSPGRTNVLAIVSLVTSFFVGLVGVVCGIIALTQIRRTREAGRGLAIAGIAVGAVQALAWVVVLIVVVIAAALSTPGSISRAIESIPSAPTGPTAAPGCAELIGVIADGQSRLQGASTRFATDPAGALDELASFATDFQSAAAKVSDPAVADDAHDAVEELNDLIAYLTPLATDPSAAQVSPAEVLDHVQDVTESFQEIQAVCSR